ncbi:MAG TPA: class I SAM-dependent methyltransferase [Polyangiaceae bacterium]|nr:class I SAM-dependent methyltransferase [Polyangiaceae bacterium]
MEIAQGVQPHNEKARSVWNAPGGRYEEISRSIADAIEHAVERLEPATGERILDLATGTGLASRLIAQRLPGTSVTGVDIADELLAAARGAAARQQLALEYIAADAEKLPFGDGHFDAVVSTFGVMFASRQEAAAAELARVVKPGGRVVLATWKPDSNVAQMFGVMKPFMPPAVEPAPPSPFAWGSPQRLQELLGAHFDLGFEHGTNYFRYAAGERAWQLWVNHYGPTLSLARNLDDERREAFRKALIAWHETFTSALGYEQPRTYLITRAIRKSA